MGNQKEMTGYLNEGKSNCPSVSIILLNWNNYEDTAECIRSLGNLEYPNYSIYVVDNGSTDGSRERLQDEFPHCSFVINDENLGFSKGCNRGIREALPESEYVLLLNNDCKITAETSLHDAVKLAESHNDIGIVGGKIYYESSDKIWSCCGEINWFRGRGIHYGHNTIDKGSHDEIKEVNFVSGALMLIHSDVIEDVGYLPENYFFGAEEWDFSVTVSRHGYALYYCPSFQVEHAVGNSHETFDLGFVYNTYRNKLLFQRRNLGYISYLVWYAVFRIYVATFLRNNLKRNIKPEDDVDIDAVVMAVKKAIDDHTESEVVDKEDIEQFSSLE